MITGESIPVEKNANDEAIGATINKTGVLTIKALKVGADDSVKLRYMEVNPIFITFFGANVMIWLKNGL
jgi:hypothetical protein